MRRALSTMAIVTILLASPAVARSQSLAAVAAQSESRPGAAAKTYTNADLPAADAGTPATGGVAPAESAAVKPADTTPAPGSALPEKPGDGPGTIEEYAGEGRTNMISKAGKSASSENEPFWRETIKNVKARIATAEAELRLIDTRLQAADGTERERLLQARGKVERNLGLLNAEHAGHLKRAKLLGVPAEWLR
jgi:hypothetical protein